MKILRFHTFSLFVKVHILGFSLFFQKQILSGDFRGSPSHPRKIHPHPQKSPSPGIFSESDSSPIPIPIPGIWGWGSGIPKNPHPRCISDLNLTRRQAPQTPVRSLYYLTLTLTLRIIIGFENEFGFEKIFGSEPSPFPALPNPGGSPRPPIRSLYYLTLTLTLKIIIGFEIKFGNLTWGIFKQFEKKV